MAIFSVIKGALGLANKAWDAWRRGLQRRAAKKRIEAYRGLEDELEKRDDKETADNIRRLMDDD